MPLIGRNPRQSGTIYKSAIRTGSTCKTAISSESASLDHTQEVAGSSPASSTKELS